MTPEAAFGDVVRRLRRERGLSQEQLGFEAGYHRVYIGLVERGQKSASLSAIFRLAHALDVPPSELLRRAETQVDTFPTRRTGHHE